MIRGPARSAARDAHLDAHQAHRAGHGFDAGATTVGLSPVRHPGPDTEPAVRTEPADRLTVDRSPPTL